MKKLKQLIIDDGLNPRKELLIFFGVSLLFIVAGVLAYVFLKQWIYLLLFFALVIVFAASLIFRYYSLYGEMLRNRNYELIKVLTYFHIYIHNGYNVYQAFIEIKTLSSIYLVNCIDALLGEMDEDKTVQPFINFSKKFTHPRIEQLLVSIYQMIDQGEDEAYLKQFDHLFLRLQDETHNKSLDEKNKKLGNLSTLPLIGAALIIILISIATVIIIGSYSSGF